MNIAIVSHDAGGAEVLSSYIKETNLRDLFLHIDGPAKEIFERKGLTDANFKILHSLDNIDYLLASMSWSNDFALRMIGEAKEKAIRTEMILDSWYDYSQRFGFPNHGWEGNLPDNLIVCDDIAERIVKDRHLDRHCLVRKIKNPYFKEILSLPYLKKKKEGNGYILFLSSPISEGKKRNIRDLKNTKINEKDLLYDILILCRRKNIPLKVRLHPFDAESQRVGYGSFLKNVIVSEGEDSLLKDLHDAKYVIGFCSMALVIAALVGKIAICFSKEDLKDVYQWEKYGVYRYYGIRNCRTLSSISRILSGFCKVD